MFERVAPEIADLAGAASAQETLTQAGLNFVQRLRDSAGDDPALRMALARLLIKVSQTQNPGNANTVGDYETGLKRAQQAMELLATGSLQASEAERLQLLWWAKFGRVQCLYGLGRFDEGVEYLVELDALLDQLEGVPDFARQARRFRMSIRNSAGYNTILAGRPEEAINRFLLPILSSDWARSITNTSEGYELESLMNANVNVATAYLFLKRFEAMIPYADESVRIAEFLVRRFPRNARYAVGRVNCLAFQGYALMRTTEIDRGLAVLSKSREEIESLISKDPVNDQFRLNRAITAAIQALAFAGWSEETSAPASERRQRLAQAQAFLADAEQFSQTAKSKEAEVHFEAARAEVATARAKLETDEGAQPKP